MPPHSVDVSPSQRKEMKVTDKEEEKRQKKELKAQKKEEKEKAKMRKQAQEINKKRAKQGTSILAMLEMESETIDLKNSLRDRQVASLAQKQDEIDTETKKRKKASKKEKEGGAAKHRRSVGEHDLFVDSGTFGMKGDRPSMEDASIIVPVSTYLLAGVFDGHGGSRAAEYCAEHFPAQFSSNDTFSDGDFDLAMRTVYETVDEEFCAEAKKNKWSDGTTALVLMVTRKRKGDGRVMIIANAGDCRAVLSRAGVAAAITEDHKPHNAREKERIEAAGGRVIGKHVNGLLGVSRAIGDNMFKPKRPITDNPVSCLPDVFVMDVEPDMDFVIMACDGVWDVVDNDTAVALVRNVLNSQRCCKKASQHLAEYCYQSGSTDNITCSVIMLNDCTK